jgi:elongation factor G
VRVLDGAVAVFDGVAGVQAQSVTVWRQASRYGVPAVAFVNKLDRVGASLEHAVQTINERLGVRSLPIQVPIGVESHCNVIADVLALHAWHWRDDAGEDLECLPLFDGQNFGAPSAALLGALGAKDADILIQRSLAARTAALETIAERTDDTAMLDACFAELGGGPRVGTAQLRATVRQQVLARRVDGVPPLLPVLCGSALKKRGIQPLLDAVLDYLPAPHERVSDASAIGPANGPLRALAFKVVHDHQRGPVVWLRILSGTMRPGDRVHNVTRVDEQSSGGSSSKSARAASRRGGSGAKAVMERAHRLLQLDADDAVDVKEACAGDIVAAVGFKRTATGDTLIGDGSGAVAPLEGVRQQPQVFSCSVEPANSGQQASLDEALALMRLEDPSFGVTVSRDTGQQLISGMGKLHLEIVIDRLAEHYKVPVHVGEIFIAYRAMPSQPVANVVVERDVRVNNTAYTVVANISLEPSDDAEPRVITPDTMADNVAEAVEGGVNMAATQGALAGFPLTRFVVTAHSVGAASTAAADSRAASAVPVAVLPAIEACVTAAVMEAARRSEVKVLEPVMRVEIELSDQQYFGAVVADVTNQRRGTVEEVVTSATSGMRKIRCFAPLKELVSYSDSLRSLSKGTASFVMEVSHYDPLPKHLEAAVLTEFGIVVRK